MSRAINAYEKLSLICLLGSNLSSTLIQGRSKEFCFAPPNYFHFSLNFMHFVCKVVLLPPPKLSFAPQMIWCKMSKVGRSREKVRKTPRRPCFYVSFWSSPNCGDKNGSSNREDHFFWSSTNFGDKNGSSVREDLFLLSAYNLGVITNSYSVREDHCSPKILLAPPENSVLATCLP